MGFGSSWACKGVLIAAVTAASVPAAADGTDDQKVGIAAALGLTAASGKTTIAEGGGAVEAALLTSGAVREAGRVIAALAVSKAGDHPILVVARSEQPALMSARIVTDRLTAIDARLRRTSCTASVAEAPGGFEALFKGAPKLGLPDITAAVATDTTYAPIPLTFDDRMLVAATAMSGTGIGLPGRNDWTLAEWQGGPRPSGKTRMIVPSEITAVSGDNSLLALYEKTAADADILRSCGGAEAKAAVGVADAYIAAITSPSDKTGSSELVAALQLADTLPQAPYVLRVVVEQTGGTAITRSNIWYTLGFPGAVTLSSGLLASFRLMNPATGETLTAGFVRCAIAPVNINNVYAVVNPRADTYFSRTRGRGQPYCSYIATPE
jgi:hypothetical protein